MATSGSYDWTMTRTQVITGALRKLGALPSGGAPSAAQTSDAADALNALIKAFQADGMPVWAIDSTTFTVTSGISTYTIGPGETIDIPAAPLKVLQAQRTLLGGENVPLQLKSRYDFNALPISDTITGTPVALYYQPLSTNGIPTGSIHVWPNPDDSTTVITLDYQRPFDDMDGANDNLDFPSYWVMALIYNLAWALSPEFGIPVTERTALQKEALYWKEEALSYGTEEGSIYFQATKRQ